MNLFSLRRNPPSLDDLAVDAFLPSKDDNLSSECLMPSVERPKQIFVRGQGSWLWDSDDPLIWISHRVAGPIASDTVLRFWSTPSRRRLSR